MARLGNKYIAGFLDADGCIEAVLDPSFGKARPKVTFAQNTSQDEVLHRIQEEIGGTICYRTSNMNTLYSSLTLYGDRATMFLNRISQYLVIKRHYANIVTDLATQQISRDEVPLLREYLKIHRRMPSLPLPKHPTRRWTAGYLDGDGCLSISRVNKSGAAGLILHVASHATKTEGLELLQKAYGGNIYGMCKGRCRQWTLHMDPAKFISVFDELAQYMVVKGDQARFLLGCAKMGHFRDGEIIRLSMKLLKVQPHRLNEPRVPVSECLANVRDLPKFVYKYDVRGRMAIA